jgi:shikimate dehydrogenase
VAGTIQTTAQIITGRTAVLAIIGDPIVQARAPGLVNPLLAARGINAVLVPLQVRAGALEPAVAGLRAVDSFRGAIVTMPHKTAVMALLDEVSPEAREVGACNVIRRTADGRLTGTMLDGEGFAAGLVAAGHTVRGKRVFLAGAGGAASAIAFALARRGVGTLVLHNRTRAKTEALGARLRAAYPAVETVLAPTGPAGCDIAVNGTSVGMKAGDPLPFDLTGLAPPMVAADVMSHRERTEYLAEAERRGCAVHSGIAMLAHQIELMVDFMCAGA